VEELFAGTGVEPHFEEAAVDFRYESMDELRDEFVPKFGPLVMLRQAVEPEGRWEEAKDTILTYFGEANEATDGSVAYPGEYLVTLGTKGG
jgi:hypothetical protein